MFLVDWRVIIVRVDCSLGSAEYLGLVDTGSSFVILPEGDCENLGLVRDEKRRKVLILTVKGETVADLYVAPSLIVMGTNLSLKKVEGFINKIYCECCTLLSHF